MLNLRDKWTKLFRQEVAFERIVKHLVNRIILIASKYEKNNVTLYNERKLSRRSIRISHRYALVSLLLYPVSIV